MWWCTGRRPQPRTRSSVDRRARQRSAVCGPNSCATSVTVVHGKPTRRECSRTVSSSVVWWTQYTDKIRRDLRQGGMAAVPSRRRSTTVSNAAGLTNRQTEVLTLLGEGLTNAEMAARLYLSEKTVDHHVSAILARLEVTNRREAVRRGRELGILD